MLPETIAPPARLDPVWPDPEAIELIVEERVAERLEAETFLWRFRLIAVETVVMGMLVLLTGLLIKQPTMQVLQASLIVAASCFATGLVMLGLSAWTVKMMARLSAWWRR